MQEDVTGSLCIHFSAQASLIRGDLPGAVPQRYHGDQHLIHVDAQGYDTCLTCGDLCCFHLGQVQRPFAREHLRPTGGTFILSTLGTLTHWHIEHHGTHAAGDTIFSFHWTTLLRHRGCSNRTANFIRVDASSCWWYLDWSTPRHNVPQSKLRAVSSNESMNRNAQRWCVLRPAFAGHCNAEFPLQLYREMMNAESFCSCTVLGLQNVQGGSAEACYTVIHNVHKNMLKIGQVEAEASAVTQTSVQLLKGI